MKKKMVLAVIFFAFIFAVSAYATQRELDDAEKKKDALEDEKKKTEALLSELNTLKSDAAAYVKKLDDELQGINSEIEDLEIKIDGVEADIEVTEDELADIIEVSKKQYEDMKLRIKYMYERGETSFFDMLLDCRNVNDFLNSAEYIGKVSEYDRNKLDEYEETQRKIEEKEEELNSEKTALTGLRDELSAKQDSVETLIADKKVEIENYEAKIGKAQNELDNYEDELKKQEDTIKAIEAEIRRKEEEARLAALSAGSSYTVKKLGDIGFIWPCPDSGRITSYFGNRSAPTSGASTYHQGVDIGAPSGTPIAAAASGTVMLSTYSPASGNYVMISHGGSVSTIYMHCSKIYVSAGESVSAGQIIAAVGSTGYSTGPHLHFGIRADGSYVNPLAYVSP